MVPFESFGMVTYSPSIVTMAVSVAICELWVRGRSRSLRMAPSDRPYATFYSSAIVNIALSCAIFEFFDVE